MDSGRLSLLRQLADDVALCAPPPDVEGYEALWRSFEDRLGNLLEPDSGRYVRFYRVLLALYQQRAMEGGE